MFEIFCPRNMLLRKGGSWWQGPSFMRFHRLETGTGLLSWADPWRGAYRCPQSDSCALKKRNRVSFGSDAPCTSLDPILWIHKSVNHSNPSERVPVRSAMRMATWKEPMQPSRWRRGEVRIHKEHQSRRSHPWRPSLLQCSSASHPLHLACSDLRWQILIRCY